MLRGTVNGVAFGAISSHVSHAVWQRQVVMGCIACPAKADLKSPMAQHVCLNVLHQQKPLQRNSCDVTMDPSILRLLICIALAVPQQWNVRHDPGGMTSSVSDRKTSPKPE